MAADAKCWDPVLLTLKYHVIVRSRERLFGFFHFLWRNFKKWWGGEFFWFCKMWNRIIRSPSVQYLSQSKAVLRTYPKFDDYWLRISKSRHGYVIFYINSFFLYPRSTTSRSMRHHSVISQGFTIVENTPSAFNQALSSDKRFFVFNFCRMWLTCPIDEVCDRNDNVLFEALSLSQFKCSNQMFRWLEKAMCFSDQITITLSTITEFGTHQKSNEWPVIWEGAWSHTLYFAWNESNFLAKQIVDGET